MSSEAPTPENLTGSMLVAHPRLLDPNFRRTILFLSHHSAEDGAIGLILNRPLKKTFGEVAAQKISDDFKNVALYYGGPVAADHLTLASLQWRTNPASMAFQSFMGNIEDVHIEPQWRSACAHSSDTQAGARAARRRNRPESLAGSPAGARTHRDEGARKRLATVMRSSGPLMKLLAEAPDDPEIN